MTLSVFIFNATCALYDCRVYIVGHVWPVEVPPKAIVHSLCSEMSRNRRMLYQLKDSHTQRLQHYNLNQLVDLGVSYLEFYLVGIKFGVRVTDMKR